MEKKLLMGNQAIALGAIRAGVRVVTGYPGTPSSEILETAAQYNDGSLYVEWSVNEKAALEVGAGAAYAGARVLVTMKQVGLNVASDPLMSLNYVGVKGGMVVVAADDPGPISSQTEQDSRFFGQFAKLAVFDPSTPEEAYEMIADAFDCSEKYGAPVLFRPTTRVCHSCASIEIRDPLPQKRPDGFVKDARWVIFPKLAYEGHLRLERNLSAMSDDFSSYPRNLLTGAGKKGFAAGGVSDTYLSEALEGIKSPCKHLKVSTYPFPRKLALDFLRDLEAVLVFEELDPVIERELTALCGVYGLPVKVCGKLTGHVPNAGENTVDGVAAAVRAFLGESPVEAESPLPEPPERQSPEFQSVSSSSESPPLPPSSELQSVSSPSPLSESPSPERQLRELQSVSSPSPKLQTPPPPPVRPPESPPLPPLPVRPPVLCAGCPHRASFFAVKDVARGRNAVFCGDIGCYTLGNAPPLDMVDTCLCMGAGITVAQGLHRIEPDRLHFAFIGDSTFFHSGIPGIVNAVYNQSDLIVVILDNGTTAMTGGQPHPGNGKTMMGRTSVAIDIPGVLSALRVSKIARANPFDLGAARAAVRSVMDIRGVRVVLFEAPCIALVKGGPGSSCAVDEAQCSGCGLCLSKLGCPAMHMESGKAKINPALCTGCDVCSQLCAGGAIGRVTIGSGAIGGETL